MERNLVLSMQRRLCCLTTLTLSLWCFAAASAVLGPVLMGAVARATRPTDRGAFLDIALDFELGGTA